MNQTGRRQAARANQRAAAFIRFQMLGDHQAMGMVLDEAGQDEWGRLAFVTALAATAAHLGTTALGRDGTLAYLQDVAGKSAVLSEADDIDRYFDS